MRIIPITAISGLEKKVLLIILYDKEVHGREVMAHKTANCQNQNLNPDLPIS